ncbi:MAG: hypothetical protein ACO24D_14800 [bacterium]
MKKPRTYITKSKAGHYTVTIRQLRPYGTYGEVYRQNYIDNLTEARRIAAGAIQQLERK